MLGTTFGGNHLACAAALAVLNIYEDEGLIENAAAMGKYVEQKVEELKKIHLDHFGRIEKYRLSDTFWYYGFLAGKGKISDPVINEAFIADAIQTTYDRTGLFIAAPKEHFDLSGLTFDKNKGFYEAKVRVIKDPIVFRYVKGGIQVLSKWGLEAEDPALQIEILN
jgi:hypothetical protein